jgi:tRNA(Arg) A34 adenosine deaminase TadA
MTTKEDFMREAIRLSKESVERGGGPFGAVIVRDGDIIARGSNSVTLLNDPTAHAEVSAIRAACSGEKTFNLEGCELYTSCEPCPMCLSAAYWAGISRIYYGNTKTDAKNIGFDDSFIYDEIALPADKRSVPATELLRDEAIKAFRMWEEKTDKVEY